MVLPRLKLDGCRSGSGLSSTFKACMTIPLLPLAPTL